MQWSAAPHAGFTSGEPWIAVKGNFPSLNVERDRSDPVGVFQRYQRLITLRREHALIRHGDFYLLLPDDPSLFAFERRLASDRLLVVANLSGLDVTIPSAGMPQVQGLDILTGKLATISAGVTLNPFAALAIWIDPQARDSADAELN